MEGSTPDGSSAIAGVSTLSGAPCGKEKTKEVDDKSVAEVGVLRSRADVKADSTRWRATRRARGVTLNVYAMLWLSLLLIVPIWLKGIVTIPSAATQPVQTAQLLSVDPPPIKCPTCNLTDANERTFVVSAHAMLVQPPSYGTAPAVLVSRDLDGSYGWWVGAVATDPLRSLHQHWNITGGCYGTPGRLYIVACLPRDGVTFVQGQAVRGPPFDDRCFAVGGYCGGTCGSLITAPPYCSGGIIYWNALVSEASLQCNATGACTYVPPDVEVKVSNGGWSIVFLWFSFFSTIVFLSHHCPPVAAAIQQCSCCFDNVRTRPHGPSDAEHGLLATPDVVKPHVEAAVAVVSVLCGERSFHFCRNLLGVAVSWVALEEKCRALGIADVASSVRFVHYVIDNTFTDNDETMQALVRTLYRVFSDPAFREFALSTAHGLRAAPFAPTDDDYRHMLPQSVRTALDDFIATLRAGTPEQAADAARLQPVAPSNAPAGRRRPPVPGAPYNVVQVMPGGGFGGAVATDLETGAGQLDPATSGFAHVCGATVPVKVVVVRHPSERGKSAGLIQASKLFSDEFAATPQRFLAVMDARHMMTPDFWPATLSQFFPSGSVLEEDQTVRLVQVMQHFPGVQRADDYFDRNNMNSYLYTNAVRDQIGAVTSCGTNALWSMRDRPATGDQKPQPFTLKGRTLIEDTETSHDCLRHGELSAYIPCNLVHGAVKPAEKYGEAPMRWEAGAMQLLECEVRMSAWFAVAIVVLYFLLPTALTMLVTCVRSAEWLILIGWLVLVFVVIPTTMCFGNLAVAIGVYSVRIVNTTYWFTGPMTAIFWMLAVPLSILYLRRLPFAFNTEVMILGSIAVVAVQSLMTSIVKRWAGASDHHLWRAQQAWFALWPLTIPAVRLWWKTPLGKPSWSISDRPAIFTALVNLLELCALATGAGVALWGLGDAMRQFSAGAAPQTLISALGAASLGLLLAAYAAVMVFPVTFYLCYSFGRGLMARIHLSKAPASGPFQEQEAQGKVPHFSGRHVMAGMIVVWSVMLWGFNFEPWTTVAFSQLFTPQWPAWSPP